MLSTVLKFRNFRWGGAYAKGIPIGNLTSQLFANVYLNEFDGFVKHNLKVKHYARYTDDFILVHESRDYLKGLAPFLQNFLGGTLALTLHPRKVTLDKNTRGVDFLGYIILPYHTVLRAKTKRKMLKKMLLKKDLFSKSAISHKKLEQSFQSYAGCLKHCRGSRLIQHLRKIVDSK